MRLRSQPFNNVQFNSNEFLSFSFEIYIFVVGKIQVLARFEDFPTKKLESLRTAAALYTKLEGIITTLENWKVVPPLGLLLDKVESYFNKVKAL